MSTVAIPVRHVDLLLRWALSEIERLRGEVDQMRDLYEHGKEVRERMLDEYNVLMSETRRLEALLAHQNKPTDAES